MLEVAGVLSALGGVVAALAHAGMVAQATLVQVRVRQGICGGDSFFLKIQQENVILRATTPLTSKPCHVGIH